MDFYMIVITLLSLICCVFAPPPVNRETAEQSDNWKYNTEGLTKEQAQDQEYFRYLTQIVGELEKDVNFKSILNNASEDDIRTGRIAEKFDMIGGHIRKKLDEVKRMEVEYQRDLLRQNKDHMSGIDRNYWNPIHHEDQETFSKEDLRKLLSKHNDMMEEQDAKRRKEFKEYEMKKEHERRQQMKNMTDDERKKFEAEYKDHHNKKHEKMHEPGHKAQLEEVWEKEDGLDPDSFDEKTFFKLHDKNSDGYLDAFEVETLFLTDMKRFSELRPEKLPHLRTLAGNVYQMVSTIYKNADGFLDQYEIETVFLSDLDKNYNESDPDVDVRERDEEMERMREHVMKTMDKDKDGLISIDEFMAETKEDDFEKDEEWKPLTEEEQFTDEEFGEYENEIGNGSDEQPPHEP